MKRMVAVLAFLAAAAALAGCSHSCIPPGWYQARVAGPLKQPPGTPKLAHDGSYDIPGGDPTGKPTRDQACLVQPPDALKARPAASAPGAATARAGNSGGR